MARPLKNEPHLTADAFLQWYEKQPDGLRYELLDGIVYKMQSERAAHGRVKGNIFAAFRQQARNRGLPCQVFVDGMAVRVDAGAVFEPDVFVRCGAPVADNLLVIDDPVIVVEVASPSTKSVDALHKMDRYFHNSHIRHYLIVLPVTRTIVHHHRSSGGQIMSDTYQDGVIGLEPQGFELSLDDAFAG